MVKADDSIKASSRVTSVNSRRNSKEPSVLFSPNKSRVENAIAKINPVLSLKVQKAVQVQRNILKK